MVGLPRYKSFDGKSPAVNFSALNREIDIGSSRVPLDEIELSTNGFLEQFGQVIRGIGCPLSSASRRLLGIANVFDGLVICGQCAGLARAGLAVSCDRGGGYGQLSVG